MGRTILVTPSQLESAAGQIEGLASDYKTLYEQFYSETSAMASAWDGKDNLAYINQIDGFKDDFAKMQTLMNNYADFLRKSAKAYRDTQDTITAEAGRLKN